MASKIKLNEKVENTERKFGEALYYFPVKVELENGDLVWAMFTETEIQNAIKRAEKNQEDIPKEIWDKVIGIFG